MTTDILPRAAPMAALLGVPCRQFSGGGEPILTACAIKINSARAPESPPYVSASGAAFFMGKSSCRFGQAMLGGLDAARPQ